MLTSDSSGQGAAAPRRVRERNTPWATRRGAASRSCHATRRPPPPPPILVDGREAARLMSISPRKLWDLTARREVRSLKVGRCVRYRVADLHAWAAKRAQPVEA